MQFKQSDNSAPTLQDIKNYLVNAARCQKYDAFLSLTAFVVGKTITSFNTVHTSDI